MAQLWLNSETPHQQAQEIARCVPDPFLLLGVGSGDKTLLYLLLIMIMWYRYNDIIFKGYRHHKSGKQLQLSGCPESAYGQRYPDNWDFLIICAIQRLSALMMGCMYLVGSAQLQPWLHFSFITTHVASHLLLLLTLPGIRTSFHKVDTFWQNNTDSIATS